MIVYQLELKSKFRLMCEGGYINTLPSTREAPPVPSQLKLNTTHHSINKVGFMFNTKMCIAFSHTDLLVS